MSYVLLHNAVRLCSIQHTDEMNLAALIAPYRSELFGSSFGPQVLAKHELDFKESYIYWKWLIKMFDIKQLDSFRIRFNCIGLTGL